MSSETAKRHVDRDGGGNKGCKHYKRRCLFVSPCCGKTFPCRVCHDEDNTHVLDRRSVNEIICSLCNTKQSVSDKCSFCDVIFGKYFCSICRLYDDTNKGQFHCDECGICRVGGRRNFFHCETCGMCLPLSLQNDHKCIERNSHQDCPVCMEDIHTSRDTTKVSDCGHLMHSKCFQMYFQKGQYRCPICNVSLCKMDDMWKLLDEEIRSTPMPAEYASMQVWILCQDCHEISRVLFHVVGLKCRHCGSYNTCRTDAPANPETEV